ncbi:hypothetical protein G0U57_005709, partial [Chelydra serpentina]
GNTMKSGLFLLGLLALWAGLPPASGQLHQANAICQLPAEPGPCFTYSRNYFYNSVTRFDTMFRCLKTCGSSVLPQAKLPLQPPALSLAQDVRISEMPPALKRVKNGECPAPINGAAATCDNFCSIDSDCPGSERCCSNGCGRKCKLPIGVNPGYCPKVNSNMVTICLVDCSNDRECGAGKKCCSLGCHVQCTQAVPARPGTCPKRKVLQTFAPCENKCEDDWNCPIRQKCCFTGCGLGCLAPITGDICRLPPEKGPCEARIPRFFYNPASRTCQRFYYGGCQGNRNNFRTFRACQRACRNLG